MTDPTVYLTQNAIFRTDQPHLHTDITGSGKTDSEDIVLFNKTLHNNSEQIGLDKTAKDALLIETPRTETPGAKILKNMVSFDKAYQDFFIKQAHPVEKQAISADNSAELGASSAVFPSPTPVSMLELVRETHTWAIRASLWSTQINLLTTTVGKATGGLETLFRNGGG